MKYLISVILSLTLVGCWSTTTPSESLTGTEQDTPIDRYADKNDLIMSRAAAAVQVAIEANRKENYAVVDNELLVASQYLPRPEANDLEFAKARASKANAEEYKKALDIATKHQKQLDDLWGKVEREKQKALDELAKKEMELKAERDKMSHMILVGCGAIGMLAGIVGLLLGMNKLNCSITIAGGAAVASLSWFFDSPYFKYVAVVGAGAFVLEIIWIFTKRFLLTKNQES